MIDTKNPLEIAREALRQLNARKLLPTPANYQACYNEVANLPNVAGFPEAPLRQIAKALPSSDPKPVAEPRTARSRDRQRSWQGVQAALLALINGDPAAVAALPARPEPPDGYQS
ncbi:MAG: hypothetical protein V5B44_13065 [Candidatus Accumulibacter necessarius]|jgi:diguanylate cyclase|uniref:hypothetical protein n=1 Tax=Candidatus Accumulibacter necessarius TaxID=2954386 RepID=UPI002FC2DC84